MRTAIALLAVVLVECIGRILLIACLLSGCGADDPAVDAAACTDSGSDVELCRAVSACGTATLTDKCGNPRSVDCGATCTAPNSCADGVCKCTPTTDKEACTDRWGTITVVNDCTHVARLVDCGDCQSGWIADPNNTCVCEPETDAQLCRTGDGRKVCQRVEVTDKCGEARAVECGACGAEKYCGLSGAETVKTCIECGTLGHACCPGHSGFVPCYPLYRCVDSTCQL